MPVQFGSFAEIAPHTVPNWRCEKVKIAYSRGKQMNITNEHIEEA